MLSLQSPTAYKETYSSHVGHQWAYDGQQGSRHVNGFYCLKCNRFLLCPRPSDLVPECCPNA